MKYLVYLVLAFATVFFALPRIPIFSQDLASQIFSIVWMFFALLVIGSYLDRLIDIDDQKKKTLARIEKYNLWKKEQKILEAQSKRFKSYQ